MSDEYSEIEIPTENIKPIEKGDFDSESFIQVIKNDEFKVFLIKMIIVTKVLWLTRMACPK